MQEDNLIPLGWSNDPFCLLINIHFVETEGGVSWRIEKELTSKTEAMYFVYNEITDTIIQVTSWTGFLERFSGSVTELFTRLLAD